MKHANLRSSLPLSAIAAMAFSASASAAPPEIMMAKCRAKAGAAFKTRLPNIDTKYEGQRVDGTHAVNGTARFRGRVETFQCSFSRSGKRIIKFIVNKPPARPAKPIGGSPAVACLEAVAKTVGKTGLTTISVTKGETATIVMVRVPGAERPWRCDYGAYGVLRVLYTGRG